MDDTILKRTRKKTPVEEAIVSEDDESSSSDDSSDDSYRSSSKKLTIKKRGKLTASVYKPPVQKLRSILAEKTRRLKDNSKKNSRQNKKKRDEIVSGTIESTVKNVTIAVENVDKTVENQDRTRKNVTSNLKDDSKPAVVSNEIEAIDCIEILDDSDDVIYVENNVPLKLEKFDVDSSKSYTKPKTLVCENEVSSSILSSLKPAAEIEEIPATIDTEVIPADKSEKISFQEEKPIVKHEFIKKEFTEKKKEPIVLTLSTSKNSPYITPYFLTNDLPSQNSVSSDLVPNISPQVPQSPSISSSTTCLTPASSPAPLQSPNTTPSSGVARLRINPNVQVSHAFDMLANNTVPQPQRTRGQRTPRRRGTSRVLRCSPTASNSSLKPRQLFGASNMRQARPSPRPQIEVISHKKNLPTIRSTLKNGISLNNISSNGTVLFSGSGSVTIMPRKKSPKRTSAPRPLIRTDVEAIVVCKEEQGVFRYALRLANGTHHPLSDVQIKALRKQNNGVLPNKLKIPVPSDVASQVEPRFIIED